MKSSNRNLEERPPMFSNKFLREKEKLLFAMRGLRRRAPCENFISSNESVEDCPQVDLRISLKLAEEINRWRKDFENIKPQKTMIK